MNDIMNTTNLFLIVGAALLLAPPAAIMAQSAWQTVPDFQCASLSAVEAFAKDAAGNLFAADWTVDSRAGQLAQVQKSTDQGASWSVVEDFVYGTPRPSGSTEFLALGTDTAGGLYAVGYATDERAQDHWIVRKSGVRGGVWSTVDDFVLPGGESSVAQGFAADTAGNLYVAGYARLAASGGSADLRKPCKHWLVRQSRDGGHTWSTIDDFKDDSGARARAILSTPSGLFVAGSGWNGSPSGERWLVRKGTRGRAGGFRWQTVDEFENQVHGFGNVSRAQGLGMDAQGNLYAVGLSCPFGSRRSSPQWVVRRAFPSGLDWAVVDTFQLGPEHFGAASGVAASDQGGVLVVGEAVGDDNVVHWIVRQSATGKAGSWSVGDATPAVAQKESEAAAEAFGEVTNLPDGTLRSTPPQCACGLTLLCDSTRVLAGGSSGAGPGHALVRRLDLGPATEIAATKLPAAH